MSRRLEEEWNRSRRGCAKVEGAEAGSHDEDNCAFAGEVCGTRELEDEHRKQGASGGSWSGKGGGATILNHGHWRREFTGHSSSKA